MKILMLTNAFAPNVVGGAELTVETLMDKYRELGHQVLVLTLSTRFTARVGDTRDIKQLPLRNVGDPWRDTKQWGLLRRFTWKIIDSFNVWSMAEVFREIVRLDPDIVVTHNLKGFSVSAWVAAKVARKSLVHVLHDYYLICSPCTLERDGARCTKQCGICTVYSLPKFLLSRLVDAFVGVSKFVADAHVKGLTLRGDKFSTIYNTRARRSLSGSIPLKDVSGVFRIGFIGRLEDLKGVPLLFEALSKLQSGNLELVLAGREAKAGYLEAIAQRFGFSHYKHLGFVNSDAFYNVVDCVVVPSLWDEPLPGVAYEPFEYGLPVIGARVGGIPEIVRDGINGLLFDRGDWRSLARCIETLASDRDVCRKLSAGALDSVSFFDQETQVNKYVSIFLKVLK